MSSPQDATLAEHSLTTMQPEQDAGEMADVTMDMQTEAVDPTHHSTAMESMTETMMSVSQAMQSHQEAMGLHPEAVSMQMVESMTMATAVSMAEASIQAQMDAVAMAEAGLAVLPVPKMEQDATEFKPMTKKETRKNLTDQERLSIVQYLLANSAGGRLKHGDMKAAATHFGVHRATIRRLWKLHLATSSTEGLAGDVASRIKGRSGRKPKVSDEEMKERIAAIPVERRMTGRGLSAALGVSNSVVVRLVREGKLRRHPKKLHYVM